MPNKAALVTTGFTFFRGGILAVSLAASACLSAGTETDPGTPVKQQPLAGSIDGHPFSAKVAVAQPDPGAGEMDVTVYATTATCDNQPQLNDGDLEILLDVGNWGPGDAYELGGSRTVTFAEQMSTTLHQFAVSMGRVEVTDAGSTSTNGTLSIRATSSLYGSVEGQVPVVICSQ